MFFNYLIWDDRTVEHLSRHAVSIEEVYEVCQGKNRLRRLKYNRLGVFGQTEAGRYLAVVLERGEGNQFAVVTARDMNTAERRWYGKR